MNLRLALLAIAVAAPLAARPVELLSPGELSRPHAGLEGTANCTKCHPAGGKLAAGSCLACHEELRGRIAAGRGLHGRIPEAERACERCHPEHEGRDFAVVSWGKGGRAAFDHARTGTPLAGKHRKADCAKCHDPRLIVDPAVKALLGKRPERRTFLGAPTACWPCHADEHRGQVGTDCARCHVDETWRPAPRFSHAKTNYPLTGRHGKVACEKCHPRQPAAPPEAGASQVAVVVAASAVHYKGVRFGACGDCHRDPHADKFGPACTSCHVMEGWKKLVGAAGEKAFHEKTAYPLRGGHVNAPCKGCHGPFPGEKQKMKGIPFAACSDCHADAHDGRIAAANDARTCDRCHGVEGWVPVRFEAEDHAKTRYALEGAHLAAACAGCHPKDPDAASRFPAAVRGRLEARDRPVRIASQRFRVEKAADCRTCHRDPHAGQFEARLAEQGCGACHVVASWRQVRFDHQREARFPLDGKHAKAACSSCHRPGADGLVRWRPLPVACDACHADPHAGQFAAAEATDCGRCHGTEGWKRPLRFVHREPFTAFRLEGKHAPLACEKCHPEVALGGGAKARRYKPLPTECEGCHADHHKGAFRGYAP